MKKKVGVLYGRVEEFVITSYSIHYTKLYEDSTVFSDSPVEVARGFARMGATRLHVVDLDGAFAGRPGNEGIILRIVTARNNFV